MQMAVLEACAIWPASGCHLDGVRAGGTPVVGLMTEWANGEALEKRGITSDLGGTMRLGAYEAFLAEDCAWPIFTARG